MPLHIRKAAYLKDYTVEVAFSDGRRGTADLRDALRGPMFDALKDKEMFSRLRVDDELATIVWPNGADLAPEYVYFRAFQDEPGLQEQFVRWGYIAQSVSSA
ncbi:MAG: DUF2442 domain-containing protein [Candidatus Electrothrix communis]|nr:MAG: DUF2442 domain-containing protein [Candidatus Electrothrix communis]